MRRADSLKQALLDVVNIAQESIPLTNRFNPLVEVDGRGEKPDRLLLEFLAAAGPKYLFRIERCPAQPADVDIAPNL